MSARSLGSEADGMFWPGFVDAISCLVLNLLFLTMVLTIAVFVLGQSQAARDKQAKDALSMKNMGVGPGQLQTQSESQSPLRRKSLLPDLFGYAPLLPLTQSYPRSTLIAPRTPGPEPLVLKPEATPTVNGDVRMGKAAGSDAMLDIVFDSNVVIVPQERRAMLVEKLREIAAAKPEQEYELRITTDTTLSDARRNAYFRAVSVRDLMIAAGVRPLSITLRMESGGTAGGEGVVRVYPNDK